MSVVEDTAVISASNSPNDVDTPQSNERCTSSLEVHMVIASDMETTDTTDKTTTIPTTTFVSAPLVSTATSTTSAANVAEIISDTNVPNETINTNCSEANNLPRVVHVLRSVASNVESMSDNTATADEIKKLKHVQGRSNSTGRLYSSSRRVSFPENDSELVTGYLEPADPWACGMYSHSP